MPVLVKYIVTCGSNSRHMNFQRHSADDPAKLEGEVTVTPVSCVCVFVCVLACSCGDSADRSEDKYFLILNDPSFH